MSEDTEQPNEHVGNAAQAPTTEPGPTHTSYYERIADRTGDLMEASFNLAEEHLRPTVGAIKDPRDGTFGHFTMGKGGINAIPAASWDQYRLFPLRRKGTSKLTQLTSFIDVVNRFKLTHSAIFASDDMAKPSLTAVLDYHPDNQDVMAIDAEDNPPAPVQWMGHRAQYDFPLSEEWKAWIENNTKPMGMIDFARFIEDHIVDVSADPVSMFSEASQAFVNANRGMLATPTKLVEISRGLQVYERAVVREARNLSTGEAQFTFDSEHTDGDGKPLTLPTMFSIVIPVFARSPDVFRLIARFRYRKTGDRLLFWYELWRHDLTFETAFNEALEQVRVETELPVYCGAPEKQEADPVVTSMASAFESEMTQIVRDRR